MHLVQDDADVVCCHQQSDSLLWCLRWLQVSAAGVMRRMEMSPWVLLWCWVPWYQNQCSQSEMESTHIEHLLQTCTNTGSCQKRWSITYICLSEVHQSFLLTPPPPCPVTVPRAGCWWVPVCFGHAGPQEGQKQGQRHHYAATSMLWR